MSQSTNQREPGEATIARSASDNGDHSDHSDVSARLFAGDGEMARLMRATDWSQTPLGPVESWSPSLRMIVHFLLPNRFPMLLWWGPRFVQIYNDPYRPVLGTKHPASLGQSASECWAEIWDVIGPLIETPFSGGPATWSEDIFLEINRHGFLEETHFTIAYSPVPDEAAPNGIGGVLATVHEISDKVVGERRILALRDLGARVAEAKTAEDACAIATETLAQHTADIPFALLYLTDADGQHARLAATAGLDPDAAPGPAVIELDGEPDRGRGAKTGARARKRYERPERPDWPLAEARRAETAQVVENAAAYFERAPQGPWSDPPTRAVVVPVRSNIAHQLAGFLVAGVSARLQLDDPYLGFYELVSSQLATAIANARAYEEERRRAEALAEIDRAKTAFFSNVSHEFRTPLTLLLGPLEESLSAPGEELTPRQRERLEVMRRNGGRLLRLVNTLLDFARIEAGRAQAVYEPTDLAAYTAELASAFRSLIEKAGMDLIVDCPPLEDALAEPVYVDREMWEKIVLNLLSNAFKFTFDGAITVALRAVEGGEAVELRVSDTGEGIPAAELDRLFERFHRIQGARSRSYEGSGIGLALVAELVHLHGGTIQAESVEGEGTAFTVRLPTGAAHLPAGRISARRQQVSTALGATAFVEEAERWLPEDAGAHEDASRIRREITPGEGALAPQNAASAADRAARILIVDDNADMRDYLRRLLAERYDAVETAHDGKAALAAIHARPPDLVLSDVMMPELDGFGLLRALRADPATRAIPVILLSARAGEEATVEGLEAGADDYLVKPFSAREVVTRVAARLEIARLRREAETRARELESAFTAFADGIVIYDREGYVITSNTAYQVFAAKELGQWHVTTSFAERAARSSIFYADGRPMPLVEWPQERILRGETLAGSSAVDVAIGERLEERTYYSLSGAPLRAVNGMITGLVLVIRDVTERWRSEREAAERASLLEAIFAALPGQITVFDEHGTITQLSPAAEVIAGPERARATISEVTGLYDLRTPNGDPLPQAQLPLTRALQGETVVDAEIRMRDAQGRDQTILAGAAPYYDHTGRMRGAVAVAHDITDRREAERVADARAHELEATFEAAPDGLALYDAQGALRSWNANLATLFEFDRQPEYPSQPVVQRVATILVRNERDELLPLDQMPFIRAAHGETLTGPQAMDLLVTLPSGRVKALSASAAPLRDAAGNITGAVTVYRDVTERQQLEQRTHDALAALLEMAESLTEPLAGAASVRAGAGDARMAREGDVQRILSLAQRVFASQFTGAALLDIEADRLDPVAVVGLTPEIEARWWEGLSGQPASVYFTPPLIERLRAEQVIEINPTSQSPVSGQDYFGVQYALVASQRMPDGRYCMIGVEARDRPPFTPQEHDLVRAAARLVAFAVERERLARERDEGRLRELALEEATRRMDTFLGIASHELRTPLTSVTANIQLAGKQLRNARQSARAAAGEAEASDSNPNVPAPTDRLGRAGMLLERAERQVTRLDRLVSDLLDTSRIQAEKLELRREACDLSAIVREAVSEQRAAWPERGVTLDRASEATLPIWADPDRVGQVVTNLLTNALKYSAESLPIVVEVRRIGERARVAVRDQGPGLAPEQQTRLFERFYRAPGIEEQNGPGVGLGLGLYICKTIVERQGGRIGVESAPGAGSTFWFTLPLSERAREELESTSGK